MGYLSDKDREDLYGKSSYPYRECACGQQIHVGMRTECDDCMEK